jgi:hypothetical protein
MSLGLDFIPVDRECADPEFIECERYFSEKTKKEEIVKDTETPESRDQRMLDQFQALEDAGFIKYIPNDSPMPRIGRREPKPEPEPFKFDSELLEFEPEETSSIDEQNGELNPEKNLEMLNRDILVEDMLYRDLFRESWL